MLISAPPELPGLMAASVWMKKPKSEMPILRARQRRDDAAGRGLADAERIADREHEIADFKRIGIADRRSTGNGSRRVDLQHREVERLVLEQHLAVELAAVGGRDLDLVGVADDVIVGDDDAGRIDQHAGAQRLLHARRHLAGRRRTARRTDRPRTASAPRTFCEA